MSENLVDDWALPVDRAVYVDGAPGDAVEVALEDLPEDGPAVIRLTVVASDRKSTITDRVLTALTDVALEMFPAWLPEAGVVTGRSSLDLEAVRIHARRVAGSSNHYGPFLSDLAERSIGGGQGRGRFSSAEVAEGLAAILGASWGRDRVALLVSSDETTTHQDTALVSACEWLAARGFAVWLVDASPGARKRLPSIRVQLPEYLRGVDTEGSPRRESTAGYMPVAGRPHPGSEVELQLERELSKHSWASNRRLNHPFQYSPIAPRYFLDIAWLEDKFVVELDGYEHRSPWRVVKDRQRDEFLKSLGFFVLRIPNQRVQTNIWQVVGEIESALRRQRDTDTASNHNAAKEGHHP